VEHRDRTDAAAALDHSEQRYRTLVETLLTGVVQLRAVFEAGELVDFVFVETNAAFDAQLGLDRVIGKRVSELTPGFRTADPELFARYARVVRTGTPERFDAFVARVKRWFAIAVYRPSPDDIVVVLDDITARKRGEQTMAELATSESRFAKAFHSGVSGMALNRVADQCFIEVNSRFTEIVGYSRAELIGRTAIALGLIDLHSSRRIGVELAQRGGGLHDFELDLVRKTGEIATVLGSAETVDLDGVPHRLFTLADITERKHAERRLVTQHAVSRVLAAASTLFEATGELLRVLGEAEDWEFGALWLVDPPGQALHCIDVWHRPGPGTTLLAEQTRALRLAIGVGGPGQVWEHRRYEIFDIASDHSFPRARAALAAGLHHAIGFPIVHGDRVIGVVDFLCRRLRSADPQAFESFGALGRQIGQFIERTNAEAALRRSEERLQQLNAELERRVQERTSDLESFSYSVSHDLRAPLRAVNGYAQLVLEDHADQLPEEGQRLLRAIRQAGLRMGELIDDLLRFSQLGRQALRRHTIDTAGMVRGVLDELIRGRGEPAVELRIGELEPCFGDASLVRQVWTNLAANALKYSRDRSPAIIEIGCAADGAYFIRDNGVGFDPRYADRLFGVFQRLHSSGEFEGTGIGLAIVERIVRRHGGRVWADSTVGGGATFSFTLGDRAAG
jgi:PAS domain S-box-containing protein